MMYQVYPVFRQFDVKTQREKKSTAFFRVFVILFSSHPLASSFKLYVSYDNDSYVTKGSR